MFISVSLLNGFKKSLIYKIPYDWKNKIHIASIVSVPLKNRLELAIVKKIFEKFEPKVNYEIKFAHCIEQIPEDSYWIEYLKKISTYYCIDPIFFIKKIKIFLYKKEEKHLVQQHIDSTIPSSIILTQEQKNIVNSINSKITNSIYFPAILHGVTGSGKTEVYKELIYNTFLENKTSLILLPEVSLAIQFTQIFKKYFQTKIPVFGFHSASSRNEKKLLWQYLIQSKVCIIIGVHLPIFLPISNLGLIIIDEEHEIGFQEKKHPRINTKEAALMRAKMYNIPIILGSATPSLQSLYNIKHRNWHLFELKNRFSGQLPKILLVKLNQKNNRKNFWISQELHEAINKTLEKKEQIIIFLNRRGFSFFIQCKKCGFIPNCQNCSVSLTFHQNKKLICHYCNYKIDEPLNCKSCKAQNSEFLKKGIGTQQVVNILENLFEKAKIKRADLDSTVDKKKWQETIKEFQEKKIDILVGTQTITKGYHFPGVTLVGILWADINLGLPFYNAQEVTLQQLIQVAGRAGRQNKESQVIIQTMINHPIYNFLSENNYKDFFNYELENRKIAQYPPIKRLAEIELKHKNQLIVESEAQNIVEILLNYAKDEKLDVYILGPAQPPVYRLKNIYIQKIYLKSSQIETIIKIYKKIDQSKYQSSIFFTPNPLS